MGAATILIVDDEEIVRKLIRVALHGTLNAVFLEAGDAVESSKLAREYYENIDLLISDVVMPGRMSGAEMAAKLSHSRPEMKVLLMSGYAPEELALEPDWHFIQKPFGAAEIRERIEDLLTGNRVAV